MAEIIDFQGNARTHTHCVSASKAYDLPVTQEYFYSLMVMQSLANITFETIFTLKAWVYLC